MARGISVLLLFVLAFSLCVHGSAANPILSSSSHVLAPYSEQPVTQSEPVGASSPRFLQTSWTRLSGHATPVSAAEVDPSSTTTTTPSSTSGNVTAILDAPVLPDPVPTRLPVAPPAAATATAIDDVPAAGDTPSTANVSATAASGSPATVASAESAAEARAKGDLLQSNITSLNPSPEHIQQVTDRIVKVKQLVFDEIAAVPVGQRTFENTYKRIAEVEDWAEYLSSYVTFPRHVSPDPLIREASGHAGKKLSTLDVELYTRHDVFEALKEAKHHTEGLSDEAKLLIEDTFSDYERNGLDLPLDKLQRLKAVQQRIDVLNLELQTCLNSETPNSIQVAHTELEGLPREYLMEYKENEDMSYNVSLTAGEVTPIFKYVSNPQTRRRIAVAFGSRCDEHSTHRIQEATQLRHELAQLLNRPHFAAYKLETLMAKKAETVFDFLNELHEKLRPAAAEEMAELLSIKEEEMKKLNQSFDGQFYTFDLPYYTRIRLEQWFNVDSEIVRQYFPIDVVINGTFEVYEEVLGLQFESIEPANAWHPDVKRYKTVDAKTGAFLGEFYLDLHPRPGKFSHAAVWGLRSSYLRSTNERQTAIAAMVTNLSKPKAGKPALLRHSEVQTFFHEFGHLMHNLCAQVIYSRFGGTKVERDFVEAPSQMLENWVWEPEILKYISNHYDSAPGSTPLPDDLRQRMLEARDASRAMDDQRQIFLSLFDMTIHTQVDVNVSETYATLFTKINQIPHLAGTNGATTFGHMFGGYNAAYYGYLWSQVYALDMYTQFDQAPKRALDSTVGGRYRREILKPGGSRPAQQSLKGFLGRDPDRTSFLIRHGVDSTHKRVSKKPMVQVANENGEEKFRFRSSVGEVHDSSGWF